MPNSLTFFRVDGTYIDVEQPVPGDTVITPAISNVYAYVDFFPGTEMKAISSGLSLTVPDYETYGDTDIQLAPITARLLDKRLCTIAKTDPEGVELVADSAWMNLDDPLFYHVRFRNVTYGGALQGISNFAFAASSDSTPIVLTSPTLTRYAYRGP